MRLRLLGCKAFEVFPRLADLSPWRVRTSGFSERFVPAIQLAVPGDGYAEFLSQRYCTLGEPLTSYDWHDHQASLPQ